MSVKYERNLEDAARVLEHSENYDGERHERVDVGVHLAFGTYNTNYLNVDGLFVEDHLRYSLEVHDALSKSSDKDRPFYAVYRPGHRDDLEAYLGSQIENVDDFIRGSRENGFMTTKKGRETLGNAVAKVEEGGSLVIHGGLNGLCCSQFEDLVNQIELRSDREFGVEQGHLFPKKPLDRTEGFLHFEDEKTAYLKALEKTRTLY